ncbi:MAG: sdhC2 [Myxococcaceae bacterium]|nr:sdhC2 [Myxococcaceae bacterium]
MTLASIPPSRARGRSSTVGERREPSAWLRRVHSATGLVPLGAYLLFHAWEHWPARVGRDALFARLERSQSALLEVVFVLLPLLLHAVLGLRLSRDRSGAAAYASPAFRRLQLGSGLVAAVFIAFHLLTAWLPRLTQQNPLGAAYGGMVEHSGTLPGVAVHALGIAAVCTHFGQGTGAALGRLFPSRLAPLRGRQLGVLFGVLLWLAFVNELASYATLAPLL